MSLTLPRILLATAFALFALLIWQALAPISRITELPAHALPLQPVRMELPVYRPPLEASLAIINIRPLFDPARQPVEEPAESGIQSLSPPDVTLVGVVIAGQNSLALPQAACGARRREPADRREFSGLDAAAYRAWLCRSEGQ